MPTPRPGRAVLLRDGLLGSSPALIALTTTRLRLTNTALDITDADSTSQHRELLSTAGRTALNLTATGLLTGSTQTQTLLTRALARSANSYRVEFDNGDALTGSFIITALEIVGEVTAEQTYRLTLESASALTLITV